MYATFVPAECASFFIVKSYKNQWETLKNTIVTDNIEKLTSLNDYEKNCMGFVKNIQDEILCWVGLELVTDKFKRKKDMKKIWSKMYSFVDQSQNTSLINLGLRMKDQYKKHIRNIWENRREILKLPNHPLYGTLSRFDNELLEIKDYNDKNPLLTILAERDVACTSLMRLWSLLEIPSLVFLDVDIIQEDYDNNFKEHTKYWPNGRSVEKIKMEQLKDELDSQITALIKEVRHIWDIRRNIKRFYITLEVAAGFKNMHAEVLETRFIRMDMIETNTNLPSDIFSKYETISKKVEQLGNAGEELQLKLTKVGMFFVKIRWDALTYESEKIEWLRNAYPTRYKLNTDGTNAQEVQKCPSDPYEGDYYYTMDDLFTERTGMWSI